MSDSGQLQRLDDGAGSLLSYADLVLKHSSGQLRKQLLDSIKQQMHDYALLHMKMKQTGEALRAAKEEAVMAFQNGEEMDLTQLTNIVDEKTRQKMEHVSKSELTRYPQYQELLRQEAAAATASVDGDQELVRTNERLMTRDPWSQQEIRRPYRNVRCGHLYDHSSLEMVLQKHARKVTCPCVGCANKTPLRWQDLTEEIDNRNK